MYKKNLILLMIYTCITITMLYICDQVLTLNYLTKAALKLVLFSIFPIIYSIQTGENVLRSSILNMKRKRLNRNGLKVSLLLGLGIFIVMIVTYILIRQSIDIEQLISEFENKYKINKRNIIFYSLYITFINSFLEEFFFRGFLFLNIKKLGLRRIAYIFSSFMFAIYHIANFQNWFSFGVFILAIVGLFVGGCLFNYLDEEQESFINSWFIHICADLGIVTIGLHLFDIL